MRMRWLLCLACLTLLLTSACTAAEWTRLAHTPDTGIPYGSWTTVSNNYNVNTGIWEIKYQMVTNPESPYTLEGIKCYVTYALFDGVRMTYHGNGFWSGNGGSAHYLGPDQASYEFLSPAWEHGEYSPLDFTKAYPTIDLGTSAPGDSGIMTWTMAIGGVSSGHTFFVGSEVYAYPVPEPSSIIALLAGIGGLAFRRRR